MQRHLLLLLALCAPSVVQAYASGCPDVSGCGSCRTMLDQVGPYFEYQCPQFAKQPDFSFQYRPNKIVYLGCLNPNVTLEDFPVSDLQEIANIPKFVLNGCYLSPDFSLAEFTRKLGLQKLTNLTLSGNTRYNVTLRPRNFEGLSDVIGLTLSSLDLQYLDPDLLTGMPRLLMLDMRNNRVNISRDFFKPVPELTVVELGQNSITAIDAGTFTDLPNLKLLNLWRNQITKLEELSLYNLVSLELLDLTNNPLEDISPHAFSSLSALNTVHILDVHLKKLPRDLFRNNKNLQFVRIYSNNESAILEDEVFSNLTKLEVVVLFQFGLSEVPSNTFRDSVNLKDINLCKNNLTTLPKDLFQGLDKLSKLSIQFNRIEEIPNELFKDLKSLEYLDLTGNRITMVESHLFDGLTSLKNLQMARNEIHTIAPEAFAGLSELEDANLSFNQLNFKSQYSDLSPFKNCNNLKRLKLTNNNITHIYDDWTISMVKLDVLDLRYNDITKLDDADLQFQSEKLYVDLRHNKISRIYLHDYILTIKSQNLTTSHHIEINISDNPIICDCKLYTFKKFVERRLPKRTNYLFSFVTESLKCIGPESLEGTNVRNVNSADLVCEEEDCSDNCNCRISPEKKSRLMDCSNRNLTRAPPSVKGDMPIHLNISGNRLRTLPDFDNENYDVVTQLDASHNQITHVGANNILKKLEVLDLSHNNLTLLDLETLETIQNSSLTHLRLNDNPWLCTCEARDFLLFIQRSHRHVPHHSSVLCASTGKAFAKLTINDLCETSEVVIVLCALLALIAVVLAVLVALYFRYQTEIKIWLYAHQCCLGLITEHDLDKDKPYDAFISYSHKDEHFVVNELVRKLESGPQPYKLCLHYRDWMAGDLIPSQIARSVEQSKRTIIVLSKNFLSSVWGAMEFRAAHRQALVEGRARVIVVIYGEVPTNNDLDTELKAYLKMNTYVQWGDKWFWDKLRYAMPHAPGIRGVNKKMASKKMANNNDPNSLLKMNMKAHQGQSMLNMPSVSIVPKLCEKGEQKKLEEASLGLSGKELLLDGSLGKGEPLAGIINTEMLKRVDKLDDTVNEDDGFNNMSMYNSVVFSFDDSHSTTV